MSNSIKRTFKLSTFSSFTFRSVTLAGGLFNFSTDNEKEFNIDTWLKPSTYGDQWVLPERSVNWILELR